MLTNCDEFENGQLYVYKRDEEVLAVFSCVSIDSSDNSIRCNVLYAIENLIRYETNEEDEDDNDIYGWGFRNDEYYYGWDSDIIAGDKIWFYLNYFNLDDNSYIELA